MEIHDDDVGQHAARHLDRIVTIGTLRYDIEIIVQLQKPRQ